MNGWLQVKVEIEGGIVATAEVDMWGEVSLTGDTDLAEIERLTDGEYDVAWLENALCDEGRKAWEAHCDDC